MKIKIFGPGCARCENTEKIVKEAIKEAGIDAEVEKVKDVMEIAKAGIFVTPAVMIDGEVKSVGKVPTKEEVLNWIKKR